MGDCNRLRYVAPNLVDGELVIPRAVHDEGAVRWRNALVGQFLMVATPIAIIRRSAQRFWGRDGRGCGGSCCCQLFYTFEE
ncbi:unnamed protein product [Linum trigynum]|uniref:Uncharacterized protein n=1 Tax=Linum trigynum TaxID=586398 RepID=A0AAV2FAT0_9ROSI